MNLKNIIWNLLGVAVPVLLAVLVIPALIKLIGLERFGLLSIAWGVVGKVGMFDLGIGRATTQFIAKLIGKELQHQIPDVLKIATRLTVLVGSAVALGLVASAYFGATSYIKATPLVSSELVWAVIVLAFGLPVQALSATLRGVNEAFADFKGISIVRMFLGIFHFIGPLLVGIYTQHLAMIFATLVISRLLGVCFYMRLASKHLATCKGLESNDGELLDQRAARSTLLSFGGWLTVGAIAAFILNQSERVGIGILLAAAAIATFSIPFEIVLKSTIVVTAISTIAFPQLSTLCQSDPQRAIGLFHGWMFKTVGVMAIICLIMIFVLPSFLRWWIGDDLPQQAPWIGQLLCVGVLLRAANVMTCSMLHASGRADLTTKVRIGEVLIYLPILCLLLMNFGIVGAAYGWLIRMLLDSSGLYVVFRSIAAPKLFDDQEISNVPGAVA